MEIWVNFYLYELIEKGEVPGPEGVGITGCPMREKNLVSALPNEKATGDNG